MRRSRSRAIGRWRKTPLRRWNGSIDQGAAGHAAARVSSSAAKRPLGAAAR
jgi:hypothetical protein